MHDVWLIAGFGVVGYILRKADYPLAPLVLALVLGPLMEKSFRQALIAEQGNALVFFERPLRLPGSSGCGRGDRVAIVLPNGPEMAAAFVALSPRRRQPPRR
jgi:hypothetical protein